MKNLSFSSVLLFPLVIFFIMQYRIGYGDTPFWLFSVIFALLIFYIMLDVFSLKEKVYQLLKNTTLWVTIVVVLGAAFSSAIIVRHQTAPVYGVHDIILQQEAAIRYIVHGKNPYSETYFGTPLQDWHYSDTEINPALYHFVMEPFYLLFAIPFYYISNHTIGYFDGRIPLLFLFGMLLITAFFVPKENEQKRTFVTLLAFNPAMLGYTLEGRSDLFMFAFMFLGLYLLHKNKIFWAGIPFGLAFMVKQSIWPFFPIYLFYLIFIGMKYKKNPKFLSLYLLKNLSGFIAICLIFSVPFLIWNSSAFLNSTIFYLSGNDIHSYPISGYGLGMMLHQFGFIKNVHDYYPFTLWQIILGIPTLIASVFWIYKKPTLHRLIISYGIFLFIFWYSSRYFNNSHLGYLSMVFLTAYFWPENSTKQKLTQA
ncbi:MAG TPA: hypothetical protein VF189_02320 [Patescibacteria group bacterium]